MTSPQLPPITGHIARPINLIVIHCSATPSGRRIDTTSRSAAQVIDGWHQARGFHRAEFARRQFNYKLPAIGYHYVIDIDGSIETGRSLNEAGAHAQGFNRESVGICLVGGREREGRYTVAQWRALAALVRQLEGRFNVPLKMPQRLDNKAIKHGICGHRDLSPDRNGNGLIEPFEWLKTCPGFSVQEWLAGGMQPYGGHIYIEGRV